MNSLQIAYWREDDYIGLLEKQIKVIGNRYDFPFAMACYGESLDTSNLVYIDDVWFRKRGDYYVLITYQCPKGQVVEVVNWLRKRDYNVKSLGLENADIPELGAKYYSKCWYVDEEWDYEYVAEQHSKKTASHMRVCWRKGLEKYEIIDKPDPTDVEDLFYDWVDWRKHTPGYGMVIIGYAKRWIERYYDTPCPRITLLGFRDKQTGQFSGMFGYEVYKGQALVSIAKNLPQPGMGYFAKFLWTFGIEHAIGVGGAKTVYCGQYSDSIKRFLGMKQSRTYKIATIKRNGRK